VDFAGVCGELCGGLLFAGLVVVAEEDFFEDVEKQGIGSR